MHNMNDTMKRQVIVFSAPSGSGKSTIEHHLLNKYSQLEFSISATSRAPRENETNGVDYWFLTADRFRELIAEDAFIEYEEVYSGSFYGTLKSEVERITSKGHIVVFDIDVKGCANIKRIFGSRALTIFVKPPSVEELRRRLEGRGTDSPEAIERRLAKAEEELTYERYFDRTLVNDDLQKAFAEAEGIVDEILSE